MTEMNSGHDQPNQVKPSRRDSILEALARMLEESPGNRITTAALAKEVGVSEAALYRHFPSKAKMFEGLIEFIEETLFSRVSRILAEPASGAEHCRQMLTLFLAFAEKNPGITRMLTGDPLTGESDRLRHRVSQLFDRFETQLKQTLREHEAFLELQLHMDINAAANLMMSVVQGRLLQFVRSDYQRLPTTYWEDHWHTLAAGVFGVSDLRD